MKKLLAVIFAAIFIAVLFSFSASAEDLKAPAVQYKILNHDKVSLKWSRVEGAESYYIYKHDDKTGEYIKKFEVKSNKITLKNLSPDTEYSYSVAAVKSGEKSKSSNKVTFTTPVEWYLGKVEIEDDETYTTRWQMVRHHYDGSNEEPFEINGYGYMADKVKLYIDDWIYFCHYTNTNPNIERVTADGGYTEDDLISLYKIKNDGTEVEEIFPLKSYDSHNMFIEHYEDYVVFAVNQYGFNKKQKSGLYIYSINDNKVTTVIESLNMNIEGIVYYNGRLYFRIDNLKWHEHYDEENFWNPYYYSYTITSSKNCSVNLDGTDLKDLKEDDSFKNIYDEIGKNSVYRVYGEHYYYYDHGIARINIKTGQKEKILEIDNEYYLDDFEITGGYIYVNAGEDDRVPRAEPCIYYCVKCDGTGLKKQDKPFEWRY
ncbi:MAG: fibronectin type III domain-containing protein [Oscillospiraceae bacterium]|nr:fibronectin type III domain-containing protein [Oscillospiraceae bacterium]